MAMQDRELCSHSSPSLRRIRARRRPLLSLRRLRRRQVASAFARTARLEEVSTGRQRFHQICCGATRGKLASGERNPLRPILISCTHLLLLLLLPPLGRRRIRSDCIMQPAAFMWAAWPPAGRRERDENSGAGSDEHNGILLLAGSLFLSSQPKLVKFSRFQRKQCNRARDQVD